MAFNFGGAMRGLGAGLVSSGALLEKFNERKFEEEQMKIKLDREEHMERARMQAQKDLAGMQIKATQEEGLANRTARAGEFTQELGLKKEELGLKREELSAEIAYKNSMVGISAQNAATSASEANTRSAMAKAALEAPEKERERVINYINENMEDGPAKKKALAVANGVSIAEPKGMSEGEKVQVYKMAENALTGLQSDEDKYEKAFRQYKKVNNGATPTEFETYYVAHYVESLTPGGALGGKQVGKAPAAVQQMTPAKLEQIGIKAQKDPSLAPIYEAAMADLLKIDKFKAAEIQRRVAASQQGR